jgi:flagellar hook-basal body complex protein FliE
VTVSLDTTIASGALLPFQSPSARTNSTDTGSDFAALITGALSDTVSALRTAEATSVAAVDGKASTQQVVESIMAAERHVQLALAVREKIVAAYLELSRMPI